MYEGVLGKDDIDEDFELSSSLFPEGPSTLDENRLDDNLPKRRYSTDLNIR